MMTIQEAMATVREGLPDNAHPMTKEDYWTACELLAREFVRAADAGELVRVRSVDDDADFDIPSDDDKHLF